MDPTSFATFAETSLLHLWQTENKDLDSKRLGLKVDALRFNIAQLQCVKKSNMNIDDVAVCRKTSEMLTECGKLMDSQDGGLNNYAEPILSLLGTGSSKNESKKWKCHLNPGEITQKYLPGAAKGDTSTILKQDSKVFFQHLNDAEDRHYFPFTKGKIPSVNVDEQAISKTLDKNDDCNNIEPSFDLLGSDGELFQENERHGRRDKQEALFAIQDRNQRSHERKAFQADSLAANQGRGVGGRGNAYPWNRLNTSNNRRGGSVAHMSHGRGENGGTFGETRSCSMEGNIFGGNSDGFTRYSGEFARSANNMDYDNAETSCFKSASHQLLLDQQRKYSQGRMNSDLYGSGKRSLGVRRMVNTKFVPPVRRPEEEDGSVGSGELVRRCGSSNNNRQSGRGGGHAGEDSPYAELMQDERLKNIEPKMVELIMNEIMDSGPAVSWNDIAGLELAKSTIQEIVVWPMLRPDIFTGLRGPPKGILLFGPPGTGKTLIGKCIANQSGSTFFSISASSLTSKWVGEGEKMVRAMFAVARCHQPSVIFIDEIDSLLTQRSDTEHESSRRIKTEFLVQLDGATSGSEDRLLVVGATNRPQELDEAARRRLVKRLYIPLPEAKARQQIIENLMVDQNQNLTEEDIQRICQQTDGYSGADMANLCREAALGPIRSISFSDMQHITVDEVRPICEQDFTSALCSIRASVSNNDLQMYEDWNGKYGISAR